MNDDASTRIRNLILSLGLMPVVALVIVFAMALLRLDGHPMRPVFLAATAVSAVVTGIVASATTNSVIGIVADIKQKAEVTARRELTPPRWEGSRNIARSQGLSQSQNQHQQNGVAQAPALQNLRGGQHHYDQRSSTAASVTSPDHAAGPPVSQAPAPVAAHELAETATGGQVWPNLAPTDGGPLTDIRASPVADSSDSATVPATGPTSMETPTTSMLANLIRRSQAMLDRQIDLVDELESKEEDPAYLEKLFKIDHLANRMRRSADGLLVLAGADLDQRMGGPVSVLDVLRVSVGEVEEHQRVDLAGGDDSTVTSGSALPLAHMIAELIENAIDFSPPSEQVDVSGRRLIHDGATTGYEIRVVDRGIGMTADQLADAHRELAGVAKLSELSGHTIGLSVVGRLARSLGVTVELTSNPDRGIAALVTVPVELLADNHGDDVGGDTPVAADLTPLQEATDTRPLRRMQAAGGSSTDEAETDSGLPVLHPVEPEVPEKLRRSGLPSLDRARWPRAVADSDAVADEVSTGNADEVRPPQPIRPSHRKPREIERMMRRYRQGQAGVRPSTHDDGTEQ